MVLGATAGVYADHGVFGYGLFGFRLTAEHLAPNTVTQAKYLCKKLFEIHLLEHTAFCAA
jgi:hypothetical protein